MTADREIRIWDRLDRRTRVGLRPHSDKERGAVEDHGTSFRVHGRSKVDIAGFWKRSEDLRCRQGKTMKDIDFTRWNRAIQAAKENAVRRGG